MEKAVALLSGGIDSPVAIHMMKDRLDIIALHFHQKELTGEEEVDKVKKLVQILGVRKAYLVPFVNVLKHITEKCRHENYYILQKILMFQSAEKIAKLEGAGYLITGENLAQVSSQTLSNLTTITKNVQMEILRPVLTFDKQEIINKAKDIGTYDTSSGPEICSLLGPKHPATRSEVSTIGGELKNIDSGIIEKALSKAEILEF
ncbi:7-cyano-7-deazaguanine synthase [Candidatus Woesearchaeota archaeon]|nr:7-cyano-7-deazaguanine synthase [Candidatus Woesearchaeota archaeon]